MGFYVTQELEGPDYEVRSSEGKDFLVGKFATVDAATKFVAELETLPVKVFTPVSLILAAHYAIKAGSNYETILPEWYIDTIHGIEDALKQAGIPFVPNGTHIPAITPPS